MTGKLRQRVGRTALRGLIAAGASAVFSLAPLRPAVCVVLVVMALHVIPSTANASERAYQSQIKGFVHAIVRTLISGEFSGRKSPNVFPIYAVPPCGPADYERLSAKRSDPTALSEFYLSCKVVEFSADDTHIYATAYLPSEYCGTIKSAFDDFLEHHIYHSERSDSWIDYEYKGATHGSSRRSLAIGARLAAQCRSDGSLVISAVRDRGQ